jgi:hypothetical protein
MRVEFVASLFGVSGESIQFTDCGFSAPSLTLFKCSGMASVESASLLSVVTAVLHECSIDFQLSETRLALTSPQAVCAFHDRVGYRYNTLQATRLANAVAFYRCAERGQRKSVRQWIVDTCSEALFSSSAHHSVPSFRLAVMDRQPAGIVDVFDLTVDSSRVMPSYLANGCIVHSMKSMGIVSAVLCR